ncbi:MAG: hypothetical protein U0169_23700 [Polyangiaceae bacterium]
MTPHFRAGIDENGLGPRLGPLVVTAAVAKITTPRGLRALAKPPKRLADVLGDSKDLVGFGASALGEAWARALLARRGVVVRTPAEAIAAISIDTEATLRAPCPGVHGAMCWGTDGERFASDDGLVERLLGEIDALAEDGLEFRDVETSIVCVDRINRAFREGTSRLVLDLHAMERLALSARERIGEDVEVICGKVGGFDRYPANFGPLAGRLHATLVEGRAESRYRIPGLGEIAFVRDADAGDVLVGLASLVGKWVRDLAMERINRHHEDAGAQVGSANASGYHDPVTAAFVLRTALVRKERGLPDSCFERERNARG